MKRLRDMLNIRGRLARRLILGVVLFSSLITLVTTAAQLYLDYAHDVAEIENDFDVIQASYLQSLINSVWVADEAQIQTQLDGLRRLPDMEYLSVEVEDEPRWVAGSLESSRVVSRQYPLVHNYRGKDVEIGTLLAVASLDAVYGRLLDKVLVILVSNGVKTFLVAGFILAVFHLLVTRHLARIASFAREKFAPSSLTPIQLERPRDPIRSDELDDVVSALNDMQLRSFTSLAALGESETRLRGILDTAADAIITIDERGTIEDFNPAASRIFGYPASELRGRNVKLLMPEPHQDNHDRYLQNYLKTGERRIIGVGREVMGRRKDGATFPMHLSVSELSLDGRRLFTGIVHDLSERKKVEAVSTRLGRIIEESLNEVYVFEAASLRFVQVNRGARDNLGYAMEELKKLTPIDLKPEFSRQSFEDLIEPLRKGEETQIEFETFHQRRDGTTYPVEVHLQLAQTENPPVFVAIIQDMTERRRSQETLLLRERAIEAIDNGILITDPRQEDNPIIYANAAMERLTGYTRDEMIGRNPRFLQGDDRDRPELVRIRAALRDEAPVEVVLQNYRKDGTQFLVNLQISPVRNKGDEVTHFVGVHTDVTERKLAEEQLRRSQKMDAIGQLTGGVAHDFNNLLTVIMGNLEMLEPKITEEKQRAMIKQAEEAAELGASLTERLLAFSRRQPLEPRIIDVNDLVLGMADMLRRTLGESIEIITVLGSQLWRTRADPGQLENALLNLAINARDAMPDGGILTIKTANHEFDTIAAEARPDVDAGRYVALTVTDSGRGMSDEVKERAVDPFFTTKEAGAGSGLGLSMVYGFAKQSGGHLAIESELGNGTSVSLYLPQLTANAAGFTAMQEPAEAAVASGETILIVEDDPRVRRTSVLRLTELGYKVLEAGSGRAALALLADGQRVDLLFTDIVMPGGMDGRELAEEARRVCPGLKVLFTSGYAEAGALGSLPVEGGATLIKKPYKITELASKLQEALRL